MSQAQLHYDNMERVRERLEETVHNAFINTTYTEDYCFIHVNQWNEITGDGVDWDFCVDFDENVVQTLEPTDDEESFSNDNEIFGIIKNFLNGGMSRENRINRPDYDSGEPIKIGSAFNPGDIVFCDNGYGSGKGFRCKIVRKVDKSEVPGYQNPNAGDYYEVETISKQLGPQRFIKWENRLTPVQSSLKPIKSSYGNNPLPTERDYRDFVDKLNNYCKNMNFSYGPMYEFEYEPEEGMSNDGWGHEYPNFRIYDTQGNLDMFSDDSIVKYIRDELEKKGWYPEAVHSSSDFTIAVE